MVEQSLEIGDETLANLRRLAEAATPGPWKWYDAPGVKWDDPKSCSFDSRQPNRTAPYYCTGPHTDTSEQAATDAAFIAAAREAVPALVAEIERLRDLIEAERRREGE